MLSLHNVGTVKNGFKDVFGSYSPRRYSVDSIHNRGQLVEGRNSVSCHDVTVKLPKVGNKKSDKVLGENLSDLSDGGTPVVEDPIEKFVEENVSEKKLGSQPVQAQNEDLCSYMDRHSNEVCYKDREPVVEAIIVPRKKKTGHICDDDDFHTHFRSKDSKEDKQQVENVDVLLAPIPKKPQRDMDIYRKSLENLNQNQPEVVVPIRRKKSLKSANTTDLIIASLIKSKTLDSNDPVCEKASAADDAEHIPVTSDDKLSQGKHLKRYQSSGSFFNQDLVSKMKQRVLEFQMSEEYVMEDISMEENDGSQYSPGSKLDPITKKISVTAMEEPIPSPTAVKLDHSSSASDSGSFASQQTVVQMVPVGVTKSIEEKKNVTDLPAEDNLFIQSSLLLAEKDVENILRSDVNMEVLSNVLNDMYDKTVLEEFQTYLETEGTDLEDDELKLIGDHSNDLIKDLKLRKADRISPTPINEADVPKTKGYFDKTSKKPSFEDDQVSIGSISDDGYTNLVSNTNHSKEEIANKTLLAVVNARPRRESICDVDNWFNNHIDIDPPSSLLNVNTRMMRRGSDFLVGYDTSSTFPFGRSRHDSESSEFFENRMVKSVEALNKGSTSSLNRKDTHSNHSSNSSLNKDHSGLLKFIVNQSEVINNNKNVEDVKNDRNTRLNATVPRIEIVVTSGEED